MSKRFGRNQRKQMKDQIAKLESGLSAAERIIKRTEAFGRRDRNIVEETAQVLGRHFITLSPYQEEVRALDQLAAGWRVAMASQIPTAYYSNDTSPSHQEVCEIVLPILRGSVEADKLRQRVHIQFTYSGRNVGYGIDLESLALLPPRVRAERIGREMALHLLKDLDGL
jgi:hypothetical protein